MAHLEFLKAGAQILITSSYQASVSGFYKHLQIEKDDALYFIKSSVKLAQSAIKKFGSGERILIAGSVGPYGACQADGSEYEGTYIRNLTETELVIWHRPRIEALISESVDLLAIETIPSLKEALAISKVLKSYPLCKAWVTFSCRNGTQTNFGDEFGHAVKTCFELYADQLIGIGVNCTSPEYVTPLLREAAKYLPIPLLPRVVYPNSGEKWTPQKGYASDMIDHNSTTLLQTKPEAFTEDTIKEWVSLGAKVIGGCCRVSPQEINQIAKVIKMFNHKIPDNTC